MSVDTGGSALAERGLEGHDEGLASFEEDRRSGLRHVQRFLHEVPTAIPFIVLVIGILIFSAAAGSRFFAPFNLSLVLQQVTIIAVLGIAETLVILTAGIDLSVGAIVGFTSVITALLMVHGFGIPLSIALTILIGVGIGLFHGFGIVQLGLPPFIMTLATLTALRGIGLLITNGATISGMPDAFTNFSLASYFGIPSLFWMVILVGIPAYLRPVFGSVSDLVPLFGYHRRSYFALAALLVAGGFFALSLLPRYTYGLTAGLVMVTLTGGILLMVIADAVMVRVGNATGLVGRLQTIARDFI